MKAVDAGAHSPEHYYTEFSIIITIVYVNQVTTELHCSEAEI